MSSWDDRGPVLALLCNEAPYWAFLDFGRSGQSLPLALCPVRVRCAGRVDPAMVLFAFERGAEGVMVISCPEGDCRYGPGPEQAAKTTDRVRGLMHLLGLEPERFAYIRVASHDRDGLSALIASFFQELSGLERSPLVKWG